MNKMVCAAVQKGQSQNMIRRKDNQSKTNQFIL